MLKNELPNIDPQKTQKIEDLCRECITELTNAARMIDQITAFQKKTSSGEAQGPERTWENKAKAEKLVLFNNITSLLNDAIPKIRALLQDILKLSAGHKFGHAPGLGQGSSTNENDEDSDQE